MSDDLEKMTVAELKDLLREKGLALSGNKSALIDRLRDGSEDDGAEEPIGDEEPVEDEERILKNRWWLINALFLKRC